MKDRQEKLLNLVVESHINTAEPVGSRFLLSTGGLDCGEATIRNDLRALEEEGYLSHPHTSAGRMPTEKGYRFYVENTDLDKQKLTSKQNDILGMSVSETSNTIDSRKKIAKAVVELSGETVILSFSPDSVYYTGLSNLFSKPEFRDVNLAADLSAIFDHCEECLDGFADNLNKEIDYFIGKENPFGQMLTVIAFKLKDNSVFAMLGPQRMDYKKNFAIAKKVKELI